eukprot:9767907-Prorocentrum_lima.AAC.1
MIDKTGQQDSNFTTRAEGIKSVPSNSKGICRQQGGSFAGLDAEHPDRTGELGEIGRTLSCNFTREFW